MDQSLTDDCELIYLHTNFFSKKNSCIISPFDKELKIKWPIKKKYNKQKKINLEQKYIKYDL